MSKEALKLALEALDNSYDYVAEEADRVERMYGNYPTRQGKVKGLRQDERKHMEAITAIKQALEQPVQEFVCSTGLCHYKPAAPDLQAELDATNRQVEILSDALAESRQEVAKLKELNT